MVVCVVKAGDYGSSLGVNFGGVCVGEFSDGGGGAAGDNEVAPDGYCFGVELLGVGGKYFTVGDDDVGCLGEREEKGE